MVVVVFRSRIHGLVIDDTSVLASMILPKGFDEAAERERLANARLIAAAPEMMKALESALVDPSKPLRSWQVAMIMQG